MAFANPRKIIRQLGITEKRVQPFGLKSATLMAEGCKWSFEELSSSRKLGRQTEQPEQQMAPKVSSR